MMSTPVFWTVFAAAVVAVLALAYGIGWGLTDCPRWFLPCQCRTNLPGPANWPPTGMAHRAGELHPDQFDILVRDDPEAAALTLIAEWHAEAGELVVTGDVWDQWWEGVDGLERECMLVHDWLVREERLWAELKAETREMCAA